MSQQFSESDRIKTQAATYILMEPETLHDIITAADAKYQRLRREAEDLQINFLKKIKNEPTHRKRHGQGQRPGGNILQYGA